MRKKDIEIGGEYIAKVSGKLVAVRITSTTYPRGWSATNLKTGREIWIRTAARLRRPAVHAPTVPDMAPDAHLDDTPE